MSYSISVSGHKETESTEESKEFESTIIDEARKFVSALEGVSFAQVTTGHSGTVNLLEE